MSILEFSRRHYATGSGIVLPIAKASRQRRLNRPLAGSAHETFTFAGTKVCAVSRTHRSDQYRAKALHYTFDPCKLAANVRKHRVWFEEVRHFEWEHAWITVDHRQNYSETRFRALSYIGCRMYVLIFCLREDSVRIISLRKANLREIDCYAKAKARHHLSDP